MKRKIEEQLLAWKNKTADRLPLIVNGARQVGKTYILRKFGEEQFKNVVYINLETNLTIASYFNENIHRNASCGIWRRPPVSASFPVKH
ncbi:MAG: AAA family ATPase [Eubacteriales bacterium]